MKAQRVLGFQQKFESSIGVSNVELHATDSVYI